MSENQLVLVLGMHRSGTSLVTSLIEAAGFCCGKYPMKPSKDNPNGYWEDELIVEINNKLLSSLGLYWFSLVWLDLPRLKQSPVYEELLETASNYLQTLLTDNKKVVIKDPRMCILLPFWLEVVSGIDTEIKVVMVKRNFFSTARSLVKRDNFDYEYVSQLIYLHWASVVHFLPRTIDRILIQYEDVRQNEFDIRQSLMSFFGVKTAVQSTLFQRDLEHNNLTSTNDCGFCWQQKMLLDFPDAEVDEARIRSLDSFYHALNVAYFQPLHREYVINEIKQLADMHRGKRVILYGASELASVLVGQLADSIVLAVDYAATHSQAVNRYGLVFTSPDTISKVAHDAIIVGVTGRQEEITNSLCRYSSQPIIFAEELLLQN